MTITYEEFSQKNLQRVTLWHPTFGTDAPNAWTGADWSNAMAGECGEACNVVKKIRRQETGIRGTKDPDYNELIAMLGLELADTVTYADLLAQHYGLDLGTQMIVKFNYISEREGLPVTIDW